MNEHEERPMGSALWQSQKLDLPRISLEFIRHQVAKFNMQRRRYINWMYAVVGIATLLTLWAFLLPTVKNPALANMNRVSICLLLLGAVCALLHVRRTEKPLVVGDGDTVTTSLHAYRNELQKSRDYYLNWSWRWMLPVLPACGALIVGVLLYDPYPHKTLRAAMFLSAPIVGWLVAHVLCKRKAREWQNELDALDSLDK